jgi:hypothetical protein
MRKSGTYQGGDYLLQSGCCRVAVRTGPYLQDLEAGIQQVGWCHTALREVSQITWSARARQYREESVVTSDRELQMLLCERKKGGID